MKQKKTTFRCSACNQQMKDFKNYIPYSVEADTCGDCITVAVCHKCYLFSKEFELTASGINKIKTFHQFLKDNL